MACSRPHRPPRTALAQARAMSTVEAAWLGAMVEGEGTILLTEAGRARFRRSNLSVSNTEIDTIATCLRFAGAGTIYVQRIKHEGAKPLWTWSLSRLADQVVILEQITPFLTGKRGRAEEVIAEVRAREFWRNHALEDYVG